MFPDRCCSFCSYISQTTKTYLKDLCIYLFQKLFTQSLILQSPTLAIIQSLILCRKNWIRVEQCMMWKDNSGSTEEATGPPRQELKEKTYAQFNNLLIPHQRQISDDDKHFVHLRHRVIARNKKTLLFQARSPLYEESPTAVCSGVDCTHEEHGSCHRQVLPTESRAPVCLHGGLGKHIHILGGTFACRGKF